jgi:hypothetical protein
LQRQAQRAELGGRSHIRGAADRQDKLRQDQIVGMIGAFAGTKTLFGDVRLFRLQRYFANLYPTIGDGGSDVPGANIDFKASLIANKQKPLLDYKLAVRPRERHARTVYVLILIELEPAPAASLIGWASDEMLPAKPETDGPFAGAYVIPARALHPVMPLRWFEAARGPTTQKQNESLMELHGDDIRW